MGWYCLIEKEKIIVVNILNPLEQRIRAMAYAFPKLDISNIYMNPTIRSIIDLKIKHP